MKSIIFNINDLHNASFLSDHELVIGEYVLVFENKRDMFTTLHEIAGNLDIPDDEQGEVKLITSSEVRRLTQEENNQAKTTLADTLYSAFNYFFSTMPSHAENDFTLGSDKNIDPTMINEVYRLQEALVTAVQTFGINHPKNVIRDNFIATMGYWWITPFLGSQKVLDLECEFFDRYFPILQKQLSENNL